MERRKRVYIWAGNEGLEGWEGWVDGRIELVNGKECGGEAERVRPS